jgi:hypothetical protein
VDCPGPALAQKAGALGLRAQRCSVVVRSPQLNPLPAQVGALGCPDLAAGPDSELHLRVVPTATTSTVTAACWVEAGGVQDLRDGGGADAVAESG